MARLRWGSYVSEKKGFPTPWADRIVPVQVTADYMPNSLPNPEAPFIFVELTDDNATDEVPPEFTQPTAAQLPFFYFTEQSFEVHVIMEKKLITLIKY